MNRSATEYTYHIIRQTGLLLVSLALLFTALDAQAQDKTWTGSIDSEWNKAGNWAPNGVPGSSDDVLIYAQNGSPLPVISQNDVNVSSIQLSDYRAGGLTITNNRTLTVTDGLTWADNGQLVITNGGALDLTGGSFDMGYGGDSQITIDNGSFTSSPSVQIKGSGLDAGSSVDLAFDGGFSMTNNTPFSIESGSVSITGSLNVQGPFALGTSSLGISGQLTVSSGKTMNVESGAVTVQGISTINGSYNGSNGISTFNDNVTVGSGGVINLGAGEIYFNGDADIGNNGTANFGTGMVEFQGEVDVFSGGYLNVQDATVSITGNAEFTNNGNLSIDDGTIRVQGNASLTSGGAFDLNSGNLSVGGDASFTSGGTVNAGNSQIDIKGNLTVPYGGNFNAGTSTVTFSGTEAQTINTGGDDLTFHNVKVASGSSIQTDGSAGNTINIENDLEVESGASVEVKDDDKIDIQGDLDNQGTVDSEKPFIYAISTPSLTTVQVTYDKDMGSSAGNAGNYSINKGVSVMGATITPGNPQEVTLAVSMMTLDTEYELTVTGRVYAAASEGGGQLSSNHKKRFNTVADLTYYSRTSGDWNDPASWSTESHSGAPATSVPNDQTGQLAQIGSGHTITIDSEENVSEMNEILVESSGTLTTGNEGTLILHDFLIEGNGTFTLASGGTLEIGSQDGIEAEGTDEGNIRTAQRNFSNQGNYIYSGPGTQQTGTGLPQQVANLTIANPSGVEANLNIRTSGTLFLQEGPLIIPSGLALIANDKSIQNGTLVFRRILSGLPGWRMLSSPIDSDYDNFLSGILTQGYEGAFYDAGTAPNDTLQPNVLYYDESYEGTDNQRWRAPVSASTEIDGGTGFNVYLFGSVAEDNRYNDALPDTLVVEGQEFEGAGDIFDFDVTFTAEADSGWNLVGNPFGASLDWDDTADWTRTNIDHTIYVWDPDDQEYLTWNSATETGTLTDGRITPFQAFWIKANDVNPTLQVSENAKTFGGDFVGKSRAPQYPKMEVTLNDGESVKRVFFTFTEDALIGKDPSDAYLLQPPPGVTDFTEFFSVAQQKKRFVINALPREFGVPIEIPLGTVVYQNGQRIEQNVSIAIESIENVPSSWDISLIDRQTGQAMDARPGATASFKTSGAPPAVRRKGAADSSAVSQNYKILAEADADEARFMLKINPGTDAAGIPDKIALRQNYPNPADGGTTIRFNLPVQDRVSLKVYDILGRPVDTIIDNQVYNADHHDITWNASHLASGTYIYVLRTSDTVISKKLTVIK